MSTRLVELVAAVERYRKEITRLHREAVASGKHSSKTLKVWEAHAKAVAEFCDLVGVEVQDGLIRLAEEDYELRRPNIDDIFI